MNQVCFNMTIHCHQPVGNFHHVMEDAFQKSYRPFIESIEKNQFVKVNMHFSGFLLEWIEANHPEFIGKLAELIHRGQVEMVTGGFYEPILPVIPDHDQLGQIIKLTLKIKKLFGQSPSSLWLAERVWEPQLPKILAHAGVTSVFLDDTHFKLAGVPENKLAGYFTTDSQGYRLFILPGNKTLRYTIPFKDTAQTINLLENVANRQTQGVIVFADDCEKFGIWPGTYDWVYKKGWLQSMWNKLKENPRIKMDTISSILRTVPPAGRCYPPNASYMEMMEWALPANETIRFKQCMDETYKSPQLAKFAKFMKGTHWRGFLGKYEEANHLLQKVIRASIDFAEFLDKSNIAAPYTGDDPTLCKIQDLIWKSQCNDAYWHGVFGGVYAPHLRFALYQAVIEAETLIDKLAVKEKNRDYRNVAVEDFNNDGVDEIIVNTPITKLYFHPRNGGSVSELDFKPQKYNVVNALARRQESYHFQASTQNAQDHGDSSKSGTPSIHEIHVSLDENFTENMIFDKETKYLFMEKFLYPGTTFQDWIKGSSKHILQLNQFEPQYKWFEKNGNLHVVFLFNMNTVYEKVYMEKHYVLTQDNSLLVNYAIRNNSDENLECLFGVELTFNLLAGHAMDRYFLTDKNESKKSFLDTVEHFPSVKSCSMVDEWGNVNISMVFQETADLWKYPVHTLSKSEKGFEKVFQGSTLFPHWNLVLNPHQEKALSISLEIREQHHQG